jgi:protein SCO1/2
VTRRLIVAALAAIGLAAAADRAHPHSLQDLERLLGDKEKYFQAVDQESPRFLLEDADGRHVELASLRGKVVVLHFIYAGCPDVCPLHAERIAEVQRMVNLTPMKSEVQFVSITTDPRSDTPEVLRAYGDLHGLDRANWVFLTVKPGRAEHTTRELAERFGHKFVKQADGYQVHGIVTHIIDKEGRWRANFHGLKFDPTNLVLFINALVNDVQKPHEHRQPSLWERLKNLF